MNTLPIVLALAAPLLAQGPAANQFGLYPDATTFASRSGLPGTSDGDLCIQIPGGALRGVGQVVVAGNRVVGRVNAFRVLLQDQNGQTQESYTHAILGDDPQSPGQPDPGVPVFRTAALTTPPAPAGPAAWLLTDSFATPFDGVPQSATFYLAVGLPRNSQWTADGLSVFAASYAAGAFGDNPKATAPNLTFTIDRTAGNAVAEPATGRTHMLFVMTEGPVLNTGAVIDPSFQRGPDPCFGVAGLFPDRARRDGLAFRIDHAAEPGATVFVLGNLLGFGPGIRLGGLDGVIHLDPLNLLPSAFASGSLDGAGHLEAVAAPFPLSVLLGPMSYQALIVGSKLVWSNATSSDDS